VSTLLNFGVLAGMVALTEIVVGLKSRPRTASHTEGAFNLPPAIFSGEVFIDGRHRLFAARLAGLSHFPVVDLMGLRAAP
jgi:hypothetical protein